VFCEVTPSSLVDKQHCAESITPVNFVVNPMKKPRDLITDAKWRNSEIKGIEFKATVTKQKLVRGS
jgi:hypothetical protein